MLQERDSLFYKMVQQLGEAEATALTERAKQVSLLWEAVTKVRLHSTFLMLWHHGCGNKHSVSFSIISLWRQNLILSLNNTCRRQIC